MVEAICKTRVGHITQWYRICSAVTMSWVQSFVLKNSKRKSKKICKGKQKKEKFRIFYNPAFYI